MRVECVASAVHHTMGYGSFLMKIIKDEDNREHIVLIRGEVKDRNGVLCRVSSECLPGTALFSAECDCEEQIMHSFRIINKEDCGIFIYLRQEGRGHGLATKIRALAEKNKGFDTFVAVENLNLPSDIRNYSVVKSILDLLGTQSIILITNNPNKISAFEEEGIMVEDVKNIPVTANFRSLRHLHAKQKRGHKIDIMDTITEIN